MARSGSYDFSLAGDAILRGAIRIVKGIGGTPPANAKSGQAEITEAREALNMMLKDWQSQGIGMWLNKEIIVFLAYQDGAYSLGPSGDHATLTLVESEVATAQDSGNNTLVLDSVSGMSSGDAVGVELDDGTLQWTTINGAPAASTITLTAALTDDVAVDRNVYTYTTKSQRPLDVMEARLYVDAGTEIPLYIATRREWMDITNKSYNGTPSQVYYDRQLDSGILNVWPRPDKVNNYIKLSCRYPIQDIDAAANDPDWPPEVYRAVKFNVAVDLSHEYTNIDINRYRLLEKKAAYLFNTMTQYDADYGSIFFGVEDV